MNASCDAIAEMEVGPASVDLESIFRTQYPRIARVIAFSPEPHGACSAGCQRGSAEPVLAGSIPE
jgi:hypothetical protein